MLRYARWLSYRDKVLEHLGALLVMYPRGRQFTDDVPQLREAIRIHFDSGMPPSGAAVQLAAGIAGQLLQQLASGDRALVLRRLREMERTDAEALASRQISRRPGETRDPVAFAANLIGVAILIASRMADEGSLHRNDLERLLSEFDAATGGDEETGPSSQSACHALARRFSLPAT